MRRKRSWVSRGNVEGLETVLRSNQRFFKELPSQGKSERLSVHGEFVMWIKKKMGKGARKVEWF